METKLLTNDRIINTNCDDKSTTNIESNSSLDFINMSIIHEKVNSTKKAMEITQTTATTTMKKNSDPFNYETTNVVRSLKLESFVCDLSLMNNCCCSDDENEKYIENEFDSESDREQDDEVFYDSTNESESNESEKTNDDRNEEETINSCKEDDCCLSQLYLNCNDKSIEQEETATELVNVVGKDKLREQSKHLRLAFGVVLRLIFPLTNGVVQGMKGLRDMRFSKFIRYIASSRMALIDLLDYAANTISSNLSSVQVTNRMRPILNLLKIRIPRDGIESLPDTSHTKLDDAEPFPNVATTTYTHFFREPRYTLPPKFQCSKKNLSVEEYEAIKCCTLNILAEPAPGQPIRADIVFIHGLNGSLVNTWKQGLWENERRPVEFQRPPKPPIRPPKRPRHSRTSVVQPPHHKKRARYSHADVCQRYSRERDSIDEADENDYSFTCSESTDLQTCDGIEYSFPTFRLRMHDYSRPLQADHNCQLQDTNNIQNSTGSTEENNNSPNARNFNRKILKPSPNDPNYSKCWPGDWLPMDCPDVRVIALNYTTDQQLWRPVWKKGKTRSNLIQRSKEMIELLIKHRVGYGHPIVWVGHSKGGLFVKQIIVDAWESGRPAVAPFWRSSRGVFFYSVPHRGSHLASIRMPFLLRSVELIDIEKNNKYLSDLHRRFAGLYHLGHLKIEVFSFVETALTLMSVLYMRIVGVDSADPGIGDVCGIRLDHREICKPRSRDCILYKKLVNMINKVS